MGDIAVAVLQRLLSMIWIPGGAFRMGSDKHYPERAQANRVTGDRILVDLKRRRADILISDAELAERRRTIKLPALVNQTPWQEIYRQHVGQLATGADFEIALKYQHVVERYGTPRDSH